MLTIGFTNHYYTLWTVFTSERADVTGAHYATTHYVYKQNLSMDFEAAKAKVEALTDKYDIDLDIRGQGSYITERMIKAMDLYRFTFGKLAGDDMRECNDAWQLNRAMEQEPNPRRRVYARRRLLDLGELVVYPHQVTVTEYRQATEEEVAAAKADGTYGFYMAEYNEIAYKKTVCAKYATARKAKFMEAKKAEAAMQGHFFTAGERCNIAVKLVREFHYETAFGRTYIQVFTTADGKVVKYKGGTPIDIEEDGMYRTVKATIKHGEYNGVKETYLQRVKL